MRVDGTTVIGNRMATIRAPTMARRRRTVSDGSGDYQVGCNALLVGQRTPQQQTVRAASIGVTTTATYPSRNWPATYTRTTPLNRTTRAWRRSYNLIPVLYQFAATDGADHFDAAAARTHQQSDKDSSALRSQTTMSRGRRLLRQQVYNVTRSTQLVKQDVYNDVTRSTVSKADV